MWPAFPAPDYYGPSAPTRRHQPATRLPYDPCCGRGGGRRVGSHVHSRFARRGRCPALPLRPRHAYPAALQRGLPAGDINRRRSFPHKAGTHRNPAQIRQVRAGGLLLRGFRTLVPHVHLPITLAGPKPSDGADPSRRCQGCFQPAGASPPARLPPASPARCDEPEAVAFHHRTIRERLVALDVPRPQLVRTLGQQLRLDVGRVGELIARSRTPPWRASSSLYIVRSEAR